MGSRNTSGVVLGYPSSETGLTDVDLDCREAIELAAHVLQKTPAQSLAGSLLLPLLIGFIASSLASTLGKATITFEGPAAVAAR